MTVEATSRPLTSAEYFAAPGLSNSGMKHLAVSPMRYWHLFINPNRPVIEPTPEMQIGSALHCAVLEPEKFDSRYACKPDTADCLMTADDIKEWLRERGLPTGSKVKQDLIDRAVAADPEVRIFELVKEQHEAEHIGKTQFKRVDWQRIQGMAEALRNEPAVQRILTEGQAEVPMFATDPETGVLLKARMDFVTPRLILDLKTFSQQRGKSIDDTVHDAIWFEKYHVQAFWYSKIRSICSKGAPRLVVLAFVESDPPHEVRLKALRPGTLYWDTARIEAERLTRTFATYSDDFGEKPWTDTRQIEPLEDEDMKQLAYSI